jgi:hypothetical protein
MKRLLSVLACALAVLLGSGSLSEAQTKKREPPDCPNSRQGP